VADRQTTDRQIIHNIAFVSTELVTYLRKTSLIARRLRWQLYGNKDNKDIH